jgi:importin subunit beta-1
MLAYYVLEIRSKLIDRYLTFSFIVIFLFIQIALLAPHLPHLFEFMSTVYNDPERSDALLRNICGLLGDLAESFPGGEIKPLLISEWVNQCLKEGRSSRQNSATTREVARWAKEMVKRATM